MDGQNCTHSHLEQMCEILHSPYTDVKEIVAFGQAKNNFPNFQNSKKLTDCNSVQSRRQSGYNYTVTWLTGISQSGLFYKLSSVSPP